MITTVHVGDVAVEVELHGHGTPLLALHGWSVDRRLMTGCLEPLLAEDDGWLRVYPDLPGRGGSPAHASVDSSDATVDLVLAVMAAVAPGQRFAVVGESYGGYLARGLLARRPDLLGLALVCPLVTPGGRDLPQHVVLERDESLLAAMEPGLRDGFCENNVRQTRAVWERYAGEVLPGLASADETYLEDVLGPRVPLTDEDATTAAPVLVVAGRQDSVVGYRDQLRLAERFPHATVAVLDAAGHNAQFEQPEVFGSLVRAWLDRVSRA
jgi:pimeloyl-ACP methyl ester carboxylesterase